MGNMKQKPEFERIGDILKTITFDFDEDIEAKKSELMSKWEEIVGEKLSKYSTPINLDDVGVMEIKCQNSIVSNELFGKRTEINEKLKKIAKEKEINFRYIRLIK